MKQTQRKNEHISLPNALRWCTLDVPSAAYILEHWLGWLDSANPVPEPERAALRDYDFRVRELGYARDPMNKLAEQVFGADQVQTMLDIRMGREQMQRRLGSAHA